MPQLNRPDGDDLGASDELIPFKDEGEQEEKRNASGRDLDDVKSSLVNESETNSGSDSEADRRTKPGPDVETRVRHGQLFEEAVRKQQQQDGLFQPPPYVGYPFFMLPDLGNLCSPYMTANGALTPGGRTYLPFQWPLLDVPGRSTIRDSPTPTHLSSVPVMQHPQIQHLHPLLSYSPEAFSPQRASPGFSPDAGVSRSPHAACYPVSPGGISPMHHPLGWLQSQTIYPITGGFSPAALAMNASMSSLVSSSFSPRLVPTQTSVHRPNVQTSVKQEAGSSSSQPGRSMCDVQQDKDEDKKPHIKKPLNAFMLYMREERPKVVSQCKVKESATINQILGQRWHSLSKEQQSRYYELARKERMLHSKLYPGWSARDNYGKKKKRKRTKGDAQLEVAVATPSDDLPPQLKRPRDDLHPPRLHPPPHPPTVSHLTHSHLSQASPASSLDSPATPTAALASPAPPAASHTDFGQSASPFSEQLQPLSLTTKPHRTAGRGSAPSPLPFLAPPPTSAHQSAAHGALTQPLRRTNQL